MEIEHEVTYPKERASRELTYAQIPYFMQDVDLKEVEINGVKYMKFEINIYPLKLLVVCNKFTIY